MSDQVEKGHWPSEIIPSTWQWIPFKTFWIDYTDSRKKIPQKQYKSEGLLAVVDQGEQTVGGFTDDVNLVNAAPLPVVVFGDHTRAVKWIDCPFVQGADGVRVLSVRREIDVRFAYHALRCVDLPNKGYSRHFKFLKSTSFPLPPSAEQKRIASKIDSLSAKSTRARDHLDHIPRLVEKYKEAVLAAAFRGDLTSEWRTNNPKAKWSSRELAVLNGRREAYIHSRRGSRLHSNGEREDMLPSGWFPAQLSDVGNLQVGYAYKSKWYAVDGVRLLRGANIAPGTISWEEEAKLPNDLAADFSEYRVDEGDIVIAMDRPVISTGLKVARVSREDAGCLLVQRVARYAPLNTVDADYIWHLVNSQHFIEHAVTQATGSDLPHISSNDILTTPLPLPCLAEQHEIVRRVGAALLWIDRLAKETNSARALVDGLEQAVLNKAFRGELVPQNPDDESASDLLNRIEAEREIGAKSGRRSRTAQV